MKWLRLFRISSALDEALPGSIPLDSAKAAPELRQFVSDFSEIERELITSRPRVECPAFLHSSIMGAVRASAGTAVRAGHSLGWWPAAAVGLILLLLSVGVTLQFVQRRSLALVGDPAALQRHVADLPVVVLSPLSDELNRLDLDVQNTADFLLASLP
jgi:hypothetical protein